MSAIEILFGSFIAGCVCSMKKMLKKLKKSLEGKKKGVPLQSRSGRGAQRSPGEVRERGAGDIPEGHRKFIEKTGQRQYKGIGSSLKRLDRDSTREVPKNRERQFEVEIPGLNMEPRDTA